MADQVQLEVSGETFAGWNEVRITRSYLEFVPSFELAYVDRWFGQESWPILPGADAVLRFGSRALITGYVNRATWAVSGTSYRLSASGRAKTQDLVDCSATHGAAQWRNRTLTQIAGDLCAEQGIDVVFSGTDSVKFKRFALDEGETSFDAIDRMCKLRGVLATTDENGALVFVNTDHPIRYVAMPVGDAFERSLEADDQNRYSEYRIRAQTPGDDEFHGEATAAQRFEVTDPTVLRFRPLVIVGGAPGHRKELEAQAKYERNMRAGQAVKLSYSVPGILAPDDEPWAPGMVATVIDDQLQIEASLLVAEVSHIISEENPQLHTVISLVRPEMFTTLDYPRKDRKAVL